uniref:Uncharacterized protein n=1 Tax=Manihot esculenta TaxID=3983 RepID=A0A2C9U420_MANES
MTKIYVLEEMLVRCLLDSFFYNRCSVPLALGTLCCVPIRNWLDRIKKYNYV